MRDNPAWTDALGELKALDSALEAWAAPVSPEGITERIVRGVRASEHRKPRTRRLVRWLGPAVGAAAAAIVLAIVLHTPEIRVLSPPPPAPEPELVSEILNDIPDGDQFLVENLEFFQNYELCSVMEDNAVLLDEATLDALDDLEAGGI